MTDISDEQIKTAVSAAIGFDWQQGELQPVNAHDLFNIARAILALASEARAAPSQGVPALRTTPCGELMVELYPEFARGWNACLDCVTIDLASPPPVPAAREQVCDWPACAVHHPCTKTCTRDEASATGAEPSQDGKRWSAYVAGMVETYLQFSPAKEVREAGIAGIIERRLWALATPTSAPVQGPTPLTKAQRDEIWQKTSAEVAKMELAGRYEFASWIHIAVRLTEEAHGIAALEAGKEGAQT
jgi:hypothetical protein